MLGGQIRSVFLLVAVVVALYGVVGAVHLLSLLPPFVYWASLIGIATLFGAVFTVAGLFVGMEPLRRHKFMLLATGIVATFLALWVIAEGEYREANFCYFKANLDKPKPDGGYEWQLINKQHRAIMPVKYFFYRGRGGRLVNSWIDAENSFCHQYVSIILSPLILTCRTKVKFWGGNRVLS